MSKVDMKYEKGLFTISFDSKKTDVAKLKATVKKEGFKCSEQKP